MNKTNLMRPRNLLVNICTVHYKLIYTLFYSGKCQNPIIYFYYISLYYHEVMTTVRPTTIVSAAKTFNTHYLGLSPLKAKLLPLFC